MPEEKVKSNNLGFVALLLGFLLIVFFSSTYFMSYWWAHALICALACVYFKKISKYYITWLLIANVYLFSSQTRFSIEFLLITLGLSAWSLSDQYLQITKKQKVTILLSIILISIIFTLFGKSLNEKYAFLPWLSVIISFYLPVKNKLYQKSNLIATSIAIILTSISAKKSVILSYFAQYISSVKTIRSKLILVISAIAIFFFSFLYQDRLNDFYKKSINTRFIIWQASTLGFLKHPVGGNGFGIFPMEINHYRKTVNKIGGKINKHLNHAHNNFLHIAFEQGLIGLSLLFLLLLFLFKHHNACFWTLITLFAFDSSLVYSAQYLVASLIFLPSILEKEPIFERKFFVLPNKYHNFAYRLLLFISLVSFGFSIIAHYHYDLKKYDLAVKFDSEHSLYHFYNGIESFKKNRIPEATLSFERSISLSKHHGFQQGFLAVSYFVLKENEKALKWIKEAMRLNANDPQWKYIAHILFKETDPGYSYKLKKEALEQNPVLSYYDKGLMPPTLSTIGGPEDSIFWINSYQRRTEKVYLPTLQL